MTGNTLNKKKKAMLIKFDVEDYQQIINASKSDLRNTTDFVRASAIKKAKEVLQNG